MKGENVRRLLLILLLASILAYTPPFKANIAQASPTTTFFVDPPYLNDVSLTAGSTFTVAVNISEGVDVYGWQINLTWDPAVLDIVLFGWTFGGILDRPREGYWGDLLYDAPAGQKILNVTDGSKYYAGLEVLIKDDFNSEINNVGSVIGNRITLTTNLANTYTVAANGAAYPWPDVIPSITGSQTTGYVIAGETTDGATAGVAAVNGTLISIEFLVENYNSSALAFDPTLTYTINSLLVKKSVTTIDGYFKNKYPGDIDGDWDCDYDDFLAFAAAYLKISGQPGYNIEADFDIDGDVDYDDFLVFAANYLKTFP